MSRSNRKNGWPKQHDRRTDGWVKTPRLIWTLGFGKTEKLVLLSMLSYVDDQGVCWPAIDTLRKDVSGSTAGVKRALDALVKGGVLSRRPERGPGGVRRYVVAKWLLSGRAELGPGVAQGEPVAQGELGGSSGRAVGVAQGEPRTRTKEREPMNEVAVADSSEDTAEVNRRLAAEARAAIDALVQKTASRMPAARD